MATNEIIYEIEKFIDPPKQPLYPHKHLIHNINNSGNIYITNRVTTMAANTKANQNTITGDSNSEEYNLIVKHCAMMYRITSCSAYKIANIMRNNKLFDIAEEYYLFSHNVENHEDALYQCASMYVYMYVYTDLTKAIEYCEKSFDKFKHAKSANLSIGLHGFYNVQYFIIHTNTNKGVTDLVTDRISDVESEVESEVDSDVESEVDSYMDTNVDLDIEPISVNDNINLLIENIDKKMKYAKLLSTMGKQILNKHQFYTNFISQCKKTILKYKPQDLLNMVQNIGTTYVDYIKFTNNKKLMKMFGPLFWIVLEYSTFHKSTLHVDNACNSQIAHDVDSSSKKSKAYYNMIAYMIHLDNSEINFNNENDDGKNEIMADLAYDYKRLVMTLKNLVSNNEANLQRIKINIDELCESTHKLLSLMQIIIDTYMFENTIKMFNSLHDNKSEYPIMIA